MDPSKPLTSLLARPEKVKHPTLGFRFEGLSDADFVVASEPWEEFSSQRLLQKVIEILGVEFASFILIDGEGPSQFSTLCSSGSPGSWKISEPYFAQRLYWRVLENRQPRTILKSQFSLSCDEGRLLHLYQAANLCLVPVTGNLKSGIMVFGNDKTEFHQPFHEGKIRLGKLLTRLGGTAILHPRTVDNKQISQLEILTSLAGLLDADDPTTSGHGWMLVEFAEAIMQQLGAPAVNQKTVGMSALLHDIGKLGIPDAILYKPTSLDPDEWKIMHTHSTIGAGITLLVSRLVGVADIVRTHHERFDGSGYPLGLMGDAIPLGARVVGVVDSYDAMIRERPYHPARSQKEAIREIIRCRGKEFDPQVVDAFLSLITIG